MERIYLSARFERQQELRAVRNALIGYGHEVPCAWLLEEEDVQSNHERRTAAHRCVDDIAACEVFVAFTEFGRREERGSRFVELGLAIAWHRRVILCGTYEENIFHHMGGVEQVDSVAELLTRLRE